MTKYLVAVLVAGCSTAHPATPDAPPVAHDARLDAPPPPPDAPPDAPAGPNLACLGQAPAATAPDPLPVMGTLFAIDHYQIAPLAGAAVSVRRRADDGVLASAMTASDGTFATTVASDGHAIDAYFAIAATGFVAGRIDPVIPLSGGEHALMVVASDAEIARWYADANATYAPGMATLILATTDCDRMALGQTTETATPAAAITYYDDVAKRWDPTLATSTNGFALVTSPATSVTLTAHHAGVAFPPHAIAAPPGVLTVATVRPDL